MDRLEHPHSLFRFNPGTGVNSRPMVDTARPKRRAHSLLETPSVFHLAILSRSQEHIRHYDSWADLQTIIMIQNERRVGDQTQTDTRYYISSLPSDAEHLLECVRQH